MFLLVILLIHLTNSLSVDNGGDCFASNETFKRKLFYHNGKQQNISILVSSRPESRLISSVFKIFARELLGYQVDLAVSNTTSSRYTEYDPDTQFSNMSSCETNLCYKLASGEASVVPPTLLTLDMMLPPSYHVDTWDLTDCGQLGPAVRFGWFMPARFDSTYNSDRDLQLTDHWKKFRDSTFTKKFKPSPNMMEMIKTRMTDDEGRFHCTASYCSNGMFQSEECRKTSDCGLMLASFPSTSSLYDTEMMVKQIIKSRLLLNIVWVGKYLDDVVEILEENNENYILLHYTPSALVLRHNLLPVMFPSCKDPLLQRDQSDPFCFFAANRLAKVVWRQVQDEAPTLFRHIQHFGFTHEEFIDLLELYNTQYVKGVINFDEVACKWLHVKVTVQERLQNGSKRTTQVTRFHDKKRNLPLQGKPQLFIGGIFPISGENYRAPDLAEVAAMAVRDVNSNKDVLPTHELVLDINDGKCEADVVMKRFIDIIKTKDTSRFRSTVGMLGPACSDTVEPIAGVSKHFRTVVISYSAEGSISNDNSKEYPYFFRTIAENKQYKYAYIETLKALDWSKVAALTQDGQKYSDYMSTMQDEFQANNIEFVMNRKFPEEATDMRMYLNDLKDRGAKIIIGEFYASSARLIMCEAFHSKMTQKQGYVWFLPGWYEDRWYDIDHFRTSDKLSNSSSHEGGNSSFSESSNKINMNEYSDVGVLPNCNTSQMLQALHGHLSLVHSNFAPESTTPDTGNYTVGEWKNKTIQEMCKTKQRYEKIQRKNKSQKIRNCNATEDLEDIKLNKYSGYVYDAVWLYAKSLNTLISQSNKSYIQNLHSNRTVSEFVNIIKSIDFEGVSGRINFKGRPSRLSNIVIEQWRKDLKNDLHAYKIGVYKPNYLMHEEVAGVVGSVGKMENWSSSSLRWQTEDGSKPLDNPKECGVLSAFATNLDIECQLAITIAFIIGFAILLVFIFIIFLIFKRRYEMKMKATEDRMRALGLLTPMSTLTLDEWEIPRDRVVINRKLGEGAFGTVYGGESFFDEKGWVAVAVKTLKVGSTVDEKIDFLSEAEMMKRFDHRNIVKLLGVCTRNEPVYTVMEFMLYGDLKTYLLARRHLVTERNREELDEVSNKRLTSMAYDIAKGLEYLAELKYVHRDIACRNCLVNSGRTVKLADFGMTRPMFESDYYRFSKKGMLPVRWMSPESLSDGLFTPMSDIWSFGVLLYEMITFGSFPFQGLSNNQVLVHVKAGNTLTTPQGIKPQMSLLLKACWNHTPTKRPTAGEIVELLINNPRLVSPCIDVPLASVQIERTDSLEMIPKSRKQSGSQQPKSKLGPPLIIKRNKELSTETDQGYLSGAYSPMNGNCNETKYPPADENICLREPLLEQTDTHEWDEDQGGSTMGSSPGYSLGDQSGESCSPYMSDKPDLLVGSYVPSGYIVLDHTSNFHSKHSVSSL